MTEMEQRLAALEQKCDRILEQLSIITAVVQALHTTVQAPAGSVKEQEDIRCV